MKNRTANFITVTLQHASQGGRSRLDINRADVQLSTFDLEDFERFVFHAVSLLQTSVAAQTEVLPLNPLPPIQVASS